MSKSEITFVSPDLNNCLEFRFEFRTYIEPGSSTSDRHLICRAKSATTLSPWRTRGQL